MKIFIDNREHKVIAIEYIKELPFYAITLSEDKLISVFGFSKTEDSAFVNFLCPDNKLIFKFSKVKVWIDNNCINDFEEILNEELEFILHEFRAKYRKEFKRLKYPKIISCNGKRSSNPFLLSEPLSFYEGLCEIEHLTK